MLRSFALPVLGLTAALAFGSATAMAQAVKDGKGIPGGGAMSAPSAAPAGNLGGAPGGGAGMRGGPRGGLGNGAMAQGPRGGMGNGPMAQGPRGGNPGGFSAGRPGFNGNQGAFAGNRGNFQGGPRVGDNRRGRDGGWNRGGVAAGVAAGVGLGLAAGYPYGGYYDTYSYPAYPAYGYAPATAELGNYCETPQRTCQLYDPAPVGADCSCRVPGGRAQGEVTP